MSAHSMQAIACSSLSVAQRLTRLSQQYPFHSHVHLRPVCPTAHYRYLGTQASPSRVSDRKQVEQTSVPPTPPANGDRLDGDADSAEESSTPPALFAPLLGSILKFIQRRAQQQPQHAQPADSAAHAQGASTPSHQSLTTHQPQATSSTRSQAQHPQPAVDLDDPSISLLFPRLPLSPPPPLRLRPPFPTPPVSLSAGRTSESARAAHSAWYDALPVRSQAHVLLMQAAVADARFVSHLERVAAAGRAGAGGGAAGWEADMAALSRRRMADVRRRTKREDEVLEAMWRKERTPAEWTQITDGRNMLMMEAKGRWWQGQWLKLNTRMQSAELSMATEHQRKALQYERNRAETEIRAHVRLLGLTNEDATIDLKLGSLLRELRHGTASEWHWRDKPSIKRRERELQEWKARMVRSLLAEQAQWHEEVAKQQATVTRLAARQRKQHFVAAELRPIDRSNPPQSFEDLLACFFLQNSARYNLELWRQQWYLTESAHRALEQQQHANHIPNNRIKQHARFMAKLKTEAKLLAAINREHAAIDRVKRRTVRKLTTTYLTPLSGQLTGWHVYTLLGLLVGHGQGRLVGLGAVPVVAQRTGEEVFTNESLAGVVAPAPLPPSLPVTPFSWPYMLSYASSETVRSGVPAVRVREEEDGGAGGGGGGGVVVEVRNVRRDVVVWMYEAMRQARAASNAAEGVSWGDVVRVNGEGGGAEGESGSEGMDGQVVGGGGSAGGVSGDGGEHGWCVLDMGGVVVQTHSEDDTSGVTARHWLSDEEAKKRLSAIPVTRFNIITAAG